jgi:hypothetical protein
MHSTSTVKRRWLLSATRVLVLALPWGFGAIDQGRFGWQVFHDLRDGRVISRIDQYAVIDMRNAVNYQKPGFHRDTSWLGL